MNHVSQLKFSVGSNIFWFVMNISDSIHVIMIENIYIYIYINIQIYYDYVGLIQFMLSWMKCGQKKWAFVIITGQ